MDGIPYYARPKLLCAAAISGVGHGRQGKKMEGRSQLATKLFGSHFRGFCTFWFSAWLSAA